MLVSTIANALALASLLIMLSAGLALIYGFRGVMNFSHGAIYMLGAYLGYTVATYSGFWVALLIVPLLTAALGIAFEFLVIRPLHHRSHIDVAMVTYGLALAIGQLIVIAYGGEPRPITGPPALGGAFDLFGSPYPVYRVFLIVLGLGTCMLLALWLKHTRSGLQVRAVSRLPFVAQMVGVDADRLSTLVVALGTGFAGLAGVLAGPYLSVEPNMGNSIIVTCLIIVVVGGVGSIAGALLAALVFGFVQIVGILIYPAISALIPYLLLIMIMLFRPQGLLGRKDGGS